MTPAEQLAVINRAIEGGAFDEFVARARLVQFRRAVPTEEEWAAIEDEALALVEGILGEPFAGNEIWSGQWGESPKNLAVRLAWQALSRRKSLDVRND